MGIDTTYRIEAAEAMDDFSLEGETLRDALDKIAAINRMLGGNKLTLAGVRELLADIPFEREITIIDVGCGSGDMLRMLSDFAVSGNRNFKLIGVDANAFTIDYARRLSAVYPNIQYKCIDIFEAVYSQIDCDIVLATLTLHHFTEDEIISLLMTFRKQAKIGIVINDLERSTVAYRLFQLLCTIFRLNKMSREDGLISILRGFKRNELERFSSLLNFKKYTIRWKWAFRYQWIIKQL